jgi:hypothetical protein
MEITANRALRLLRIWDGRRENYGRGQPGSDNLRRRENQSMAKGMDRKKETKKPKKDKK